MSETGSTLSGDWEFDPAHTRIGFSARHAMVTTVRGSFNDVQGYFHADLDDMSKSSARVVLKAASVDTRNDDRDNHLRSADFFDVEKWPDITFESTQIEEVSDNAYVVSGGFEPGTYSVWTWPLSSTARRIRSPGSMLRTIPIVSIGRADIPQRAVVASTRASPRRD